MSADKKQKFCQWEIPHESCVITKCRVDETVFHNLKIDRWAVQGARSDITELGLKSASILCLDSRMHSPACLTVLDCLLSKLICVVSYQQNSTLLQQIASYGGSSPKQHAEYFFLTIHTHTHTNIHTQIHIDNTHTHTHRHTHTHTHTHTQVHIHTTLTQTHTHTHTHTQIHIQNTLTHTSDFSANSEH